MKLIESYKMIVSLILLNNNKVDIIEFEIIFCHDISFIFIKNIFWWFESCQSVKLDEFIFVFWHDQTIGQLSKHLAYQLFWLKQVPWLQTPNIVPLTIHWEFKLIES